MPEMPSTVPVRPAQESMSRARRTCTLALYFLSFMLFGCEVNVLGPTLTPLAHKLNVKSADLSPLFTALGIATVVGGIPSGWLVDRVPGHIIMPIALIIQAVGLVLMPWMPSVLALSLIYALISFSFNFVNSCVFTLTVWLVPDGCGPWLNVISAAFGVGSFLVPVMAESCRYFGASPLCVYYILAALCIVCAAPFFFLSSPVNPCQALPEVARKGDSRNFWRIAVISGVLSLVFLSVGTEAVYGNWIHTYCTEHLHLDVRSASFINSSFWAAFTLGRFIGVAASAYLGPVILLLVSIPLGAMGTLLPILFPGARSESFMVIVSVIVGLGNSTGYANSVAMLERYTTVTGLLNGMLGAFAGSSNMVGPVLVAALATHTSISYGAVMWVEVVMFSVQWLLVLTTSLAGRHLRRISLDEACEDDGGDHEAQVLPKESWSKDIKNPDLSEPLLIKSPTDDF